MKTYPAVGFVAVIKVHSLDVVSRDADLRRHLVAVQKCLRHATRM